MTELVRRRARHISRIDWFANQKRLTNMVAAEYTAKQIAVLLGTTPNAVRSAAKRFRLSFRPERPAKPAEAIAYRPPPEHLENHKGHVDLVLQARPQGFLGGWSYRPGGYLYRAAA
jgi:hypothetical protein